MISPVLEWLAKFKSIKFQSKSTVEDMSIPERLRKIEKLPPNLRSTNIQGIGFIDELRALAKPKAIDWLSKNVSSPVNRYWGLYLYELSADWFDLKQWLNTDKEHALAAADAVNFYILGDELPADSNLTDLLSEIDSLVSKYGSFRLKEIQDEVRRFANPPKLSKRLIEASQIVFGSDKPKVRLREKKDEHRWCSLFDKAHSKYCVVTADGKTPKEELEQMLNSLPVVVEAKAFSKELAYEELDVGRDDIIIVALPFEKMEMLKSLTPKTIKFHPYQI